MKKWLLGCSLVFVASTLIGFGGFYLNKHVMELNGGSMPVIVTTPDDRAMVSESIPEERRRGGYTHSIATPETKWAWAADRFPGPVEGMESDEDADYGISSLGDIAIVEGFHIAILSFAGLILPTLGWLLWKGCKKLT